MASETRQDPLEPAPYSPEGGPILMYDMIPGIGWVTPDHPLHSDHRRALAMKDAHHTERRDGDE